jgi:hypothetical protein
MFIKMVLYVRFVIAFVNKNRDKQEAGAKPGKTCCGESDAEKQE